MRNCAIFLISIFSSVSLLGSGLANGTDLTAEEMENLVRRSYQYVAMYNVNNKFAMKQGGWNTVDPDTELKDHTMREIARPNNDTLYIGGLFNLCKDPVIFEKCRPSIRTTCR